MENRISKNARNLIDGSWHVLLQLTQLNREDTRDVPGQQAHMVTQKLNNAFAQAAMPGTLQVKLMPCFAAFAAGYALLTVLCLAMRRIARRMERARETGVEETAVYKSLALTGARIVAAVDVTKRVDRTRLPRILEMPDFPATMAVQALYYYSMFAARLLDQESLPQLTAVELIALEAELQAIVAAFDGLCDAAKLMADVVDLERQRGSKRGLAGSILALACE